MVKVGCDPFQLTVFKVLLAWPKYKCSCDKNSRVW